MNPFKLRLELMAPQLLAAWHANLAQHYRDWHVTCWGGAGRGAALMKSSVERAGGRVGLDDELRGDTVGWGPECP